MDSLGLPASSTQFNTNKPFWEDQISNPRFKRRLKRIILGLPKLLIGGIDESLIDKALTDFLHSHSKIVYVDKKLMYVGSDNSYSCSNEERGVWIEDEVNGPYHVGEWVNMFF